MSLLRIPPRIRGPPALEVSSSSLHFETANRWLPAVMEFMVLMPHTFVLDRNPLPEAGDDTSPSCDDWFRSSLFWLIEAPTETAAPDAPREVFLLPFLAGLWHIPSLLINLPFLLRGGVCTFGVPDDFFDRE